MNASMGMKPTIYYTQNVLAMGHSLLMRNEIIIDAHSSMRLYIMYALLLGQGVKAKSTACIGISARSLTVDSLLGSIALDSHTCCKPIRSYWISRSIARDG
jgi:hypothetical protein